jgi:hypothetical protein
LISVISTPTRHEKKIPAEYRLTSNKQQQQILILVDEPAWLNSRVNLRYYLTNKLINRMIKQAKVPKDYLVKYENLSDFRAGRADFSMLSPVEVAKALQADLVLFVTIADYALNRTPDSQVFQGHLVTQSLLLDARTSQKLWPTTQTGRTVRIGFEVEPAGQTVAVERLADSTAHCIVRYFYNCSLDSFNIADEIRDGSLMKWN